VQTGADLEIREFLRNLLSPDINTVLEALDNISIYLDESRVRFAVQQLLGHEEEVIKQAAADSIILHRDLFGSLETERKIEEILLKRIHANAHNMMFRLGSIYALARSGTSRSRSLLLELLESSQTKFVLPRVFHTGPYASTHLSWSLPHYTPPTEEEQQRYVHGIIDALRLSKPALAPCDAELNDVTYALQQFLGDNTRAFSADGLLSREQVAIRTLGYIGGRSISLDLINIARSPATSYRTRVEATKALGRFLYRHLQAKQTKQAGRVPDEFSEQLVEVLSDLLFVPDIDDGSEAAEMLAFFEDWWKHVYQSVPAVERPDPEADPLYPAGGSISPTISEAALNALLSVQGCCEIPSLQRWREQYTRFLSSL